MKHLTPEERITKLIEANRELRRQRDEYAECLRALVDCSMNDDGTDWLERSDIKRYEAVLKRASELLAGG